MAASLVIILLSAGQSSAQGDDRAIYSSGCAAAPPGAPPTSILVRDKLRDIIVVVGKRGAGSGPHDLVIAFHGRTNSNAEVRDYYDLERHAIRPTIFVYPAGLPAGEGSRSWSDAGDPAGALRDYALFDAIVLRLARMYCLDLNRVFAVGHSLGASFVNNLACARGGELRGIATLAGDVTASDCSGPVAAIVFHNPTDTVVGIRRGEVVRDLLRSLDGLDTRSAPLPFQDFNCVRYGPPDATNPVVWCPFSRTMTHRGRYYPHQWPAETGMLIMAFFASLP
jgi:polyhydroxybutyrate depolymerase